MMKQAFFVLFFTGFFSLSLVAQAEPQLKIPPVTKETLSNGVKLLLIRDATLPITRVQIIFNQGAVQEPKGADGVASLASEMLLRGTKRMTKEQLRKGFETKGSRIDSGAGAKETSLAFVSLTEAFPDSLELVKQILLETNPTEKELALAKNEAMESIKSLQDQGGALTQIAFRSFVDPENPYGKFASGRLSTIPKITLSQIKDFQKSLIRGGNMTVAAVSDLDIDNLRKRLSDVLLLIPGGKTEEVKVPELKPWNGLRVLVIDKKKQETMNIQFGQPAAWAGSPERVPLLVGNYMFGTAPLISVLFREVRANRGWTYGISGSYAFQPYRSPYSIYLFPTTKFGIDAFKLSVSLFHQYLVMGVTPGELAYSKKAIINQAPFLFETAEDVLSHVLDEEIRGTPKDYYENFVSNVEKVTEESTAAARHAVHQDGMLAAVFFGDASRLMPELKKIPEVIEIKTVKANDYLK